MKAFAAGTDGARMPELIDIQYPDGWKVYGVPISNALNCFRNGTLLPDSKARWSDGPERDWIPIHEILRVEARSGNMAFEKHTWSLSVLVFISWLVIVFFCFLVTVVIWFALANASPANIEVRARTKQERIYFLKTVEATGHG